MRSGRRYDTKFAHDGVIQDPYNLRCAAQALGPCLDLIDRARRTLEIEACSVTDNPIDLNASVDANYSVDLITSGGHFHGMPLAVDVYGLLQAAAIMARISKICVVRDRRREAQSGLGPQCGAAKIDATESGLLITEYTTAGCAIRSGVRPCLRTSCRSRQIRAKKIMSAWPPMWPCAPPMRPNVWLRFSRLNWAFAPKPNASAPKRRASRFRRETRCAWQTYPGVLDKINAAFPPWVSG